ncbi:MAG: hypothetical protein P8Y44_03950 [Acidobacteriota bacterium]
MKRLAMILLSAIVTVLSASTLVAQEGAPPPTCENDPRYSQFDFWLGTWDVFVGDQKAGENTITEEEGGCLVLEKWTDVAGGTGQSYNFFNPDTEKWRQVWVSNYMTIDYSGGLTENGSMELVGQITYFHNETTLDFLGRWTLQEDGTVRQYFEQFDEEKGEMVPIFTGIYHRKQ